MEYITDMDYLTEEYLNFMAGPSVTDEQVRADLHAERDAEIKGQKYTRKYPNITNGNRGGGWTLVDFEQYQGMYKFIWKK